MTDAASPRPLCAVLLTLLALPIGQHISAATLGSAGEDIHMESAGTEVDAVTKQIKLPKVRIWQAGYEIQADEAQAKGLNFDDSQWTFVGNVHITTPNGSSTADRAMVSFVQNSISALQMSGEPATFEQRDASQQLVAQGQAEQIEYQLQKNTVRLSNNAWIKYAQNEFRGRTVVYDINSQRVLANPNEQQGERIRITITPNKNATNSSASSSNESTDQP
ncbi:MAG: lipopolysaccharide transport periplasmic protein LptA [Steroidobacteraceae bacterium]